MPSPRDRDILQAETIVTVSRIVIIFTRKLSGFRTAFTFADDAVDQEEPLAGVNGRIGQWILGSVDSLREDVGHDPSDRRSVDHAGRWAALVVRIDRQREVDLEYVRKQK